MIDEYFDFELHFSTVDDYLQVDITGRPVVINLCEPLRLMKLNEFASFDKFPTSDLEKYGKALYDKVFTKDIAEKFAAFLNRRGEFQGVRVCVQMLKTIQKQAIWEALCNELEPDIRFLALDPKTPVIRIPRVVNEAYLRDLQVPLNILFVLASPALLETIDASKEKNAIRKALQPAINKKKVKVDFLGFDDPTEANFDKLQETIAGQEPPYDVVHIIAHGLLETGQDAQLALVNKKTKKEELISTSSLAQLFTSRSTMLVVLQSCQSGAIDALTTAHSGLAEKLVAFGVPAVLAMQKDIDQDIATYFAENLYSKWINGKCPLEDAITQARQSVKQKFEKRIGSWAVPVLYMHPAVHLQLKEKVEPVDTTTRQVDAALPQQTRMGKGTELVVLIRAPNKEGLREILRSNPRDYEVVPDDVRTTAAFDASFPVDGETGKTLPSVVKVALETEDFEIAQSEKKIQIRPGGESVLCIFDLMPIREGKARVLVTVTDPKHQDVILAQLPLRTFVQSGDTFETTVEVLDAVQAKRELKLNDQALKLRSMVRETHRDFSSSVDETRHFKNKMGEFFEKMQFLLVNETWRIDDEFVKESVKERPQEELFENKMLRDIGRPSELIDFIQFHREFIQSLHQKLSDFKKELLTEQLSQLEKELIHSDRSEDSIKIWSRHLFYFLHELYYDVGKSQYREILKAVNHMMKNANLECKSCGLSFFDPEEFPFWHEWPWFYFKGWRCPRCSEHWPFFRIRGREWVKRVSSTLEEISRFSHKFVQETGERIDKLTEFVKRVEDAPQVLKPPETDTIHQHLKILQEQQYYAIKLAEISRHLARRRFDYHEYREVIDLFKRLMSMLD